MIEHPVIFSTGMVEAILAGAKWQTRRVVQNGNDIAWWGWPCTKAQAGTVERQCDAPPAGWHHYHMDNGFNAIWRWINQAGEE